MVTVGIFDSGVGGLSVWRHLAHAAPALGLIYLADQAFAPYGERPLAEVRDRSERAARALLERGAQVVVVACNTASAAALEHLREVHPDVPIVGMEPAVKPAASKTATGTIAVLATDATFRGALYAALARTFGTNVRIVECVGTGLAQQIEIDSGDSDEIRRLLGPHVAAIRDAGADVVALGCTHYPFITDVLGDMLGAGVELLDPGPAVAAQALRRVAEIDDGHENAGDPERRFLTTGSARTVESQVHRLLGLHIEGEQIVLSGLAAPG